MNPSKCPKKIIAIVEGDGEVEAVPSLLNRWLDHQGLSGEYCSPVRAISAYSRSNLKKDLERYVQNAVSAGPVAIIIIIDSDSDPDGPAKLQAGLAKRAAKIANGVPIGVVVAIECYEAWFMGCIDDLRKAHPGLVKSAVRPPGGPGAIETIADCKGRFEEMLVKKYIEVRHQTQLSDHLPLDGPALKRMPSSYKRLLAELERLTGLKKRNSG